MELSAAEDLANETGSVIVVKFQTVRGTETIGEDADCALANIEYIGRHYLVKSTSHPKTKGKPSGINGFDASKTGIKS